MPDWYTATGIPANRSQAQSQPVRAEFSAIAAAFTKLPNYTGNALKFLRVNAGATALEAVDLATLSLTLASLTLTGALTVDGAAALNGGTTIGNAAGDDFTINSATASIPNALNLNGNVGIGIAPASRLSVSGGALAGSGGGYHLATALTSGRVLSGLGAAQVNAWHSWLDGMGTEVSVGSTAGRISAITLESDTTGGNAAARSVRVWVNSAERARFDASGNILVGTSTGVASGKGLAIFDSGGVARIQLRNPTTGDATTDGSSLFISGSDFGIENREAGNILLYTNSAERLRIDASGQTLPGANNTYNLGASGTRWATVFATTFDGAVTGNVTGNASTATALQTARTIAISGGVTGTATSFDGTANITIPITAMDASSLSTGTVPLARLSGITNTEISASAAIAWSKLDKTGSSLADLTTRSASDLSSGTLPDARFPATLPAVSGVNLTSLNATNLASGTVADARLPTSMGAKTFTGTVTLDSIAPQIQFFESDQVLPAGRWRIALNTNSWTLRRNTAAAGDFSTETLPISISSSDAVTMVGSLTAASFSGVGTALTALNASNLASGTLPDARFPATLPAVSGANLTSLNATNLASGTLPDARFPATLPAVSGANLTSLNATNLASGTVANARTTGVSTNTASTLVLRDGSGNFAAGTITAALTGNASTATALQTARTINGVSFDGTANITVAAAAGTLTGTTLAAGVTASSLTSLGTLTGLTISGDASSTNYFGSTTASSTVPRFSFTGDTNTGIGRSAADQVDVITNGTTKLSVTSDGRVYGSALHNNAGSVTGTTNQYIASGTYTPTPTGVTNVASVVADGGKWIRVGNVVHVTCEVTIDPTATGNTVLTLSLPIPSNFTTTSDLSGVGTQWDNVLSVSNFSQLNANATTDEVQMFFNASSNQQTIHAVSFMYTIK